MTQKFDPLSHYVARALVELEKVTLREVQFETAKVWYGRAVAALRYGRPGDAIEYAHESIEHAALAGDDNFLRELRESLKAHGILI